MDYQVPIRQSPENFRRTLNAILTDADTRVTQLEDIIIRGAGSPEGAVTAAIGTLYLRSDGGAGSTLYVKEADDGLDTGWAAK